MSLSGLMDDAVFVDCAEGAPTGAGLSHSLSSSSLCGALLGEVKRDNAVRTIQEMQRIVALKNTLPVLEGWLERLDKRGWTMVWVVIKGSYLLWSKEERAINDTGNILERRQFDKYVNMINILEAKPIQNEHSNMAFSFVVDGREKKRYVWSVHSESVLLPKC